MPTTETGSKANNEIFCHDDCRVSAQGTEGAPLFLTCGLSGLFKTQTGRESKYTLQ